MSKMLQRDLDDGEHGLVRTMTTNPVLLEWFHRMGWNLDIGDGRQFFTRVIKQKTAYTRQAHRFSMSLKRSLAQIQEAPKDAYFLQSRIT